MHKLHLKYFKETEIFLFNYDNLFWSIETHFLETLRFFVSRVAHSPAELIYYKEFDRSYGGWTADEYIYRCRKNSTMKVMISH